MPLYPFRDRRGREALFFFEMSDPSLPTIGGILRRRAQGEKAVRVWKRLPSQVAPVVPNTQFVSHQLPRYYPAHKEAGGTFTKEGKPVFTSRRQMTESQAAAAYKGDRIDYDAA